MGKKEKEVKNEIWYLTDNLASKLPSVGRFKSSTFTKFLSSDIG